MTGSMKATLKLSAQSRSAVAARAWSLPAVLAASHTFFPLAMSCWAVVASADRRQRALKPSAFTSRSEGKKRPANEGWGQLLPICTSVLPPKGTMARRSVPTSSSSSVAERPLVWSRTASGSAACSPRL